MAQAHNPNYVGNVPPLWLGKGAAIPPGTIEGQILYWDGANWVLLDPGNNGQQLTTHGDGAPPTWEAGEAVLGEYWPPELARLATVAGFAAAGTALRNQRLLITFRDDLDVNCVFDAVLGDAYAGGDIQLDIDWISAAAVVDNVRWGIQWERMAPGGLDLDGNGFAAAQFATDPTNGTSGVITRSQITFTNAQADAIAAGDSFRLLLFRDTSVADNMVGDAQMVRVAMREV
jgi:hypothetical protein